MNKNTQLIFEPFTVHSSFNRASEVSRLVRNNLWLPETVYADAAKQYARATKGALNLFNLATQREVRAGILREHTYNDALDRVIHDTAVGLGWIISSQTIRHPGEDLNVQGTHLDYWLDGSLDADPEAHEAAAHCLLIEQREMSDSDAGAPYAFATVVPDAEHQPVGFAQHLECVGFPAQLSVPGGNDPYGIVKGGATLQLYVSPQAVAPTA
jgi:hypothetical protein